jgi:beta-lactamase regulating signal transducer with metallopeptidase domain
VGLEFSAGGFLIRLGAVIFALAAIIIVRVVVVLNKVRACKTITRDALRDRVRRRCATLGIGREAVLQYGDAAGVDGPATMGVLRSAILLLREIVNYWNIESIEPVIVHELVHIRRRDLLVNWLQIAVQEVWSGTPTIGSERSGSRCATITPKPPRWRS